MAGRPPITLTSDQVQQIEALASVLNQNQIADYLGISKNTFEAIMKREPDILALYKKGVAKAIGKVGQGLLQQALGGDRVCAMFYLKTQGGWREKLDVDMTSSDGSMAPASIDYKKISTAALKELRAAMVDETNSKP